MYADYLLKDVVAPDDNAILWRYFKFEHFCDLINTSTLYFSRADKFEDKNEGITTDGTYREIQNQLNYPVLANAMTLFIDTMRNYMFVSCWHMCDAEVQNMWTEYGASGVAIQTTSGQLKAAISDVREVAIGQVQYVNPDYVAQDGDVYKQMLVKHTNYAPEKEVRLMHCAGGPSGWLDSNDCHDEIGLKLTVDLKSLISNVVMAPNSSKEKTQQIKSLLNKQGLDSALLTNSSLE
jgi:hypothetical protein